MPLCYVSPYQYQVYGILEFVCATLLQAVCCSDHLHCCPEGHTCNLQAQSCDQQNTRSVPWFKKRPALQRQVSHEVWLTFAGVTLNVMLKP